MISFGFFCSLQFGVPSINSFQLIGSILKAPDRCRQRELEHFPMWLYLVEMYHADSQIVVGTIVQLLASHADVIRRSSRVPFVW